MTSLCSVPGCTRQAQKLSLVLISGKHDTNTSFFHLIGWGVFAETDFPKGSFILIYHGDTIGSNEADEREASYKDTDVGSYMFYFKHGSKTMW